MATTSAPRRVRVRKRAAADTLVTTTWVGAETNALAARNNRMRIIEGGDLKHLLAEHLIWTAASTSVDRQLQERLLLGWCGAARAPRQ